ncbi:MAG: hypothetical protein JXA67_14040 [Micromonosporaceae bacterium]|nr:hypothetical protein [Micromonosporaceae bacterium]
MADIDDVKTPANLAGGTYEGAVRSKASELKELLINQTLADVESWVEAMQNQYELAHPDRPNDRVIADGSGWVMRSEALGQHEAVIPEAELEQYRNSVRNEYYEWVVPAFERYLEPDPDAISPMIEAMRTIEGMFHGATDNSGNASFANAGLARTHDVRTELGHWQGRFQEDFIDNFLTPLETVSINQASLAKAVRSQLVCGKGIYLEYRDAVIKLLDKSIEAVKLLNNQRDPKPCMWGTLVGISLGTVLTLASGGIAATGVALIVGSTLAQGVIPDPPKKNDLAAPTAQEVAVKIADAMGKLDVDVSEHEQSLETAFRNISNAIAGARDGKVATNTSGPLSVAAPDLDTAPFDEIARGLRPRG